MPCGPRWTRCSADQRFVLGPHVERFEAQMAAYAGVPHAVGVASGTDALAIGLAGLGVGPGTRVLTTAFSFFSSASTIVRLGGRPVFADIDPRTLTLDPAAAADALARADGPVAGMVPVHLFGRLAPMPALEALAKRHGLWMLEDAAQAVGARAGGRRAGSLRAGRRALLLSHEEPRRHRGRGHGADGRRGARRTRPA